MFSLIIPVLNEEDVIEETIRRMEEILKTWGKDFEIVVVDDGSTDRTAEILGRMQSPSLRVVKHERNRGNGAAIKTGVRHAKGEIVGTIDADGTYPMEDYPRLLRKMEETNADMLVGARTKKGVQIPWNRRPAKAIVTALASWLVGTKIPDINSGMRIVKRELFERFEHLYPQGFSLHMTITLSAITNNYSIHYEPIDYFKRVGSSTMSSGLNGLKHFVNFLGLIVRIVMYFRPLKFFIWPGAILMVAGIAWIADTVVTESNISDTGLLFFLSGLQICLFGLLAEVIVRNRHGK